MINKEYLVIPEEYDKLIVSLRTAQAKEYSLDKSRHLMMIYLMD
jgi:hypothetical protein